jgi:hypothetical protein
VLKKISNLWEDFLILVSQFGLWVYVLALGFMVMFGLAFPLAAQALEWLQDGVASPRDGFWLYTLSECGEGSCRPLFVAPTDWVGVNRIINWIMELHVAVYSIVVGWIGYGLALAWAESLGGWKAREARLRAPPPPPDVEDV